MLYLEWKSLEKNLHCIAMLVSSKEEHEDWVMLEWG